MSQPLQQKNTRILLTWLPFVMLAGSFFFYNLMKGHILHTQTQQLQLKQDNIWRAFTAAPNNFRTHIAGEYDIVPARADSSKLSDHPRDTTILYPGRGNVDFNILTRHRMVNGASYLVTTYISSKEIRHLIIKVGIAEAILFLSLLAAIVIVNWRISRRLWTPFYTTMNTVRDYDIRQNKPLSLAPATGVEEFDRLNQTLLALIDHVGQAYRNQKQFTENASHELQTPVAIIRSKVELLMEGAGLNEDSAGLLQEITEANERLSQMNKNLLLLTRIENSQYPEVEPVALSDLVERLSGFFREYYENGTAAITTTVSIRPNVTIFANPSLIEILVNNLLRNAYIHNIPHGWVEVQLSGNALTIQNSGPILQTDPQHLFDRFRKGQVDNRTTGLGLSLVRQIAQLYFYDVRYNHQNGKHQLTISFPNQPPR